MKSFWSLVAIIFVVLQQSEAQDNGDAMDADLNLKDVTNPSNVNEVDDDPLMAPLSNGLDLDDSPASPEPDADIFVPLPGINDLIKDSEHVMREETSHVRNAIHHEQMAMLEAGISEDDTQLEKEVDLLEHNTNSDIEDSIFNTDDFDDDWDDL